MINYRTLLVSRAGDQAQEDAPRALSPTQFKNRQSLEAWRERWAKHHAVRRLMVNSPLRNSSQSAEIR